MDKVIVLTRRGEGESGDEVLGAFTSLAALTAYTATIDRHPLKWRELRHVGMMTGERLWWAHPGYEAREVALDRSE